MSENFVKEMGEKRMGENFVKRMGENRVREKGLGENFVKIMGDGWKKYWCKLSKKYGWKRWVKKVWVKTV